MTYSGMALALIIRGYASQSLDNEDFLVLQQEPRKQPGQVAFRSGEIVPVSGIWRPGHDDCAVAVDLWLQRHSSFPLCPACGASANFFLIEEVQHISEDPDFQ
jgi:hypothetical protein